MEDVDRFLDAEDLAVKHDEQREPPDDWDIRFAECDRVCRGETKQEAHHGRWRCLECGDYIVPPERREEIAEAAAAIDSEGIWG